MKVVINGCFGGFGLSDQAYEQLIEWGIPVVEYIREERNPKTGLYDKKIKQNEGKVIFDRALSGEEISLWGGRYWETWLKDDRENPLLIKVVELLRDKASGRCSNLKVISIPNNVKYTIEEYDGLEHIAEEHRTWR